MCPLDATATRAQLADQARNPRRTVKGSGEVIDVRLVFDNKSFVPEDLFDALETKYGAGKVTSDRDTMGHRQFVFRVKP